MPGTLSIDQSPKGGIGGAFSIRFRHKTFRLLDNPLGKSHDRLGRGRRRTRKEKVDFLWFCRQLPGAVSVMCILKWF